jgi:formylglycine-generating enzyme required for sulfatase activity
MKKIIKWISDLIQTPQSHGIQANEIHAHNVVAGINVETLNIGGQTPDDEVSALRRAYLYKVMCNTGILPLEGVDPKAMTCAATDHLNLGSVYTALLTQSAAHDEETRDMDRREVRRISALEFLDQHPHVVLLGDPGSGKSTFVNFAALCLAGEIYGDENVNIKLLTQPLPGKEDDEESKPQPWNRGPLLPVRIILRDFAARGLAENGSEFKLWDFITSELGAAELGEFAPHLKRELRQNGGLIMFDGLDEVPEAENRRLQIRKAVQDFMTGFPRCRILVTSRTYAYQKQEWRIPGLSEAILAPFSEEQIIHFIERWYAHIARLRGWNPDHVRGKAELLKRAVLGSIRLRELAGRPLLLTLMASLHSWRGGSLPEKREELYADTVDLLLDRWESGKNILGPDGGIVAIEPSLAEFLKADKDQIRRVLDELAYNAHANQPDLQGTADISEKDLVYGLISASSQGGTINHKELILFLNYRAGLLIPRGVGVYTFPHRTFQEYLAACHLTNLDYPDKVAELTRNAPDRWREAALLAAAKASCGASANIWSLAEACCFRDPDDPENSLPDIWGALLAGQTLVENAALVLKQVSPKNRPKLDRVRQWQVKIVQGDRLPPTERALSGRNLAALGDPRKEVMTLEHMEFCLVPGGGFYMGDGKDRHLNTYLTYDFWMSRHPVTHAQYAEFVKAGGYGEGQYWKEAETAGLWKAGQFKGRLDSEFRTEPYNYGSPYNLSNHPVVGVTWYEALAFTRWLTGFWQESGILDREWSVRLPSEAEWEKAARGGVELPELPVITKPLDKAWGKKAEGTLSNPYPEKRYPWGENFDMNKANTQEAGIGATSPAGCFPSGMSPCGCFDMAGNVWEWTRSLWENEKEKQYPYPYKPDDGREDESLGRTIYRVLRGGAYYNDSVRACCAGRNWYYPVDRDDNWGFRCACSRHL